MRRVVNVIGRGVSIVAVVAMVAVPVVAAPREKDPKEPAIIRIIKKLVSVFGDAMIEPRP